MTARTTNPTRSAFHVLIKPTGARCNLDCSYCFYLSKESLYPGSSLRMTDDVLETYIRQLFECQKKPEVEISWQGGEPTLMGLDFFRRSVELSNRYKGLGQSVHYSIQTNGTLLDREWCEFFKANDFLVGLSIDGPQDIHDTYRVDKGGKGSFDRVKRGWEQLLSLEVDVNILCTVHAANADFPLDIYRFFRDELGGRFFQFIPIVERVTKPTSLLAESERDRTPRESCVSNPKEGEPVTSHSVEPIQFGRFLNAIFDEWVRRDVGHVFVQHFDSALANWCGEPAGVCVFSATCGQAMAMEHNGDLYSCDHFVEPTYLLGNIKHSHLRELVSSPTQVYFGQSKRDSLPQYCLECDVRFACHGGCPKNRFLDSPDGQPGLNYLCQGYQLFFRHIDPDMRIMSDLLRKNQAPAGIMTLYKAEEERLAELYKVTGRNAPCPCGSGKKFKHCHGAVDH